MIGPKQVPSVEPEYEDEPDVIINVYQGKQGGYGITCTQQQHGPIVATVVTNVDSGSEAAKAGVQNGDRLVVCRNVARLPD